MQPSHLISSHLMAATCPLSFSRKKQVFQVEYHHLDGALGEQVGNPSGLFAINKFWVKRHPIQDSLSCVMQGVLVLASLSAIPVSVFQRNSFHLTNSLTKWCTYFLVETSCLLPLGWRQTKKKLVKTQSNLRPSNCTIKTSKT